MRERVDLKSPVRKYRPPGSVRGAPGNRRPYLDRSPIFLSSCSVAALPRCESLRLCVKSSQPAPEATLNQGMQKVE